MSLLVTNHSLISIIKDLRGKTDFFPPDGNNGRVECGTDFVLNDVQP